MSNVRVNLLPDDVRKKCESNRANGIIAGSFVLLLVLIAGVGYSVMGLFIAAVQAISHVAFVEGFNVNIGTAVAQSS